MTPEQEYLHSSLRRDRERAELRAMFTHASTARHRHDPTAWALAVVLLVVLIVGCFAC